MLTKKQNWLYWREWNAALKYCQAHALPEPDRHELHTQALGQDKSHVVFNNSELDKVLGAFRAISQPASLHAQVRQAEMPRTRLLYGLRNHPLGPAYLAAIARSKFGTSDLDVLRESQLEQLRDTLASRLAAKRRKVLADGTNQPF